MRATGVAVGEAEAGAEGGDVAGGLVAGDGVVATGDDVEGGVVTGLVAVGDAVGDGMVREGELADVVHAATMHPTAIAVVTC